METFFLIVTSRRVHFVISEAFLFIKHQYLSVLSALVFANKALNNHFLWEMKANNIITSKQQNNDDEVRAQLAVILSDSIIFITK